MKKISILIAEDHRLVRETWATILGNDPRFEVVAECADTMDAIEKTRIQQPDIVLMDILMQPFSGIEATGEIARLSPNSRVVGLTMYSKPEYAKKMFQVGAWGYVTKNSSREEMVQAILDVKQGNRYVCNEVKELLSRQLAEEEKVSQPVSLSKRESEIVEFVKKGFSSKKIADQLEISAKTVQVHRHNILKKLKLKNCVSAINFLNRQTRYL